MSGSYFLQMAFWGRRVVEAFEKRNAWTAKSHKEKFDADDKSTTSYTTPNKASSTLNTCSFQNAYFLTLFLIVHTRQSKTLTRMKILENGFKKRHSFENASFTVWTGENGDFRKR